MGEWNEKGLAIAFKTPGDIAAVRMITTRDDTCITYAVHASLRSMSGSSFEVGEDEVMVWHAHVAFGSTDATVAGGAMFVQAAREQERAAEKVWTGAVWTGAAHG